MATINSLNAFDCHIVITSGLRIRSMDQSSLPYKRSQTTERLMPDNREEQHEKEGICIADVVKCTVACLERNVADSVLSRVFPTDENGQHVCGIAADWRNGVIRH